MDFLQAPIGSLVFWFDSALLVGIAAGIVCLRAIRRENQKLREQLDREGNHVTHVPSRGDITRTGRA